MSVLATGALLVTGLGIANAPAATAHTPEASATCDALSVTLANYSSSDTDPTPNVITVSIDGATVAAENFGQSFSKGYPLGSPFAAHTYTVVVDATGGDTYDRTFTGSSVPCAPAVDAAATLATTPATCETAETLVPGEVVNATWGEPTLTAGPGDYSVTATATEGHVFDDGTSVKTFTGTLAGILDPAAEPCYVAPPVPEQPEPVVTRDVRETVSCDAREVTTVTTTTTVGWRLDEEANVWVKEEPVVETASLVSPVTVGQCLTGGFEEPEEPVVPNVEPPVTVTVVPTPPTPPAPPAPAVVLHQVKDAPITPASAAVTAAAPTPSAAGPQQLAKTGADAGVLALAGGLLLIAGVMLTIRRTARS